MSADPMSSMIRELGDHISRRERSPFVLRSGGGERFAIEAPEFMEISPVEAPRRMAFVDGGNGTLEESPSFLIAINRIYFSIFRGREREKAKSCQRIQFFSCTTTEVRDAGAGGGGAPPAGGSGGRKGITYRTRLFAYGDGDMRRLPDEGDLSYQGPGGPAPRRGAAESVGRRFAEWKLALHVVEDELERGDMIVMDGALGTEFKSEAKYANALCERAVEKGVIVCGLSKTSMLVTESGDPLLARVSEVAEGVRFGRWFVRVADRLSSDDRGFVLATKLHERSRFVFRFEILREQFRRMGRDEVNSVLASLAANSEDVAMVGYPYGAIDADRFAQVRMKELDMYRWMARSKMLEMPEWREFKRHDTSLEAHDVLNRVSG